MLSKNKAALVLLTAATGSLLPLTAAHAAYSITARPASASADAGTVVTISGKAAGGAATRKVVQQTYEAGRWVTRASDSTIPGGSYSINVRGSRPGAVKYRAVAVDGKGSVLAVSPTVSVSWFTWQPLVAARSSFQSVAGGGYVGGMTNDGTFSFAGASYDRSLQYRDYRVNRTASVAAHYYVGKACTTLRYALGMDSQSHPSYRATSTLKTDGATRHEVSVRYDGPAEHREVAISGVNEVSFFLDMITDTYNTETGKVDVGRPVVRCKTDIRR